MITASGVSDVDDVVLVISLGLGLAPCTAEDMVVAE
jgi:hypothetical protein